VDGSEVAKIQDDDLRSFAEGEGADQRESVIVELEHTPTVRPPANREQWVNPSDFRYAIEAIEGVSGDDADRMDELQRQFQGLDLPDQPVRLDTAQAFVVDLTPNELRQVTEWSNVGPIRPNRTHKASQQAGLSKMPSKRSADTYGPSGADAVSKSTESADLEA